MIFLYIILWTLVGFIAACVVFRYEVAYERAPVTLERFLAPTLLMSLFLWPIVVPVFMILWPVSAARAAREAGHPSRGQKFVEFIAGRSTR